MREEPRPSEIRRLVLKLFRQWGTAPSRLFEMQEKIRVDRHRVIARTYCVDRLMAMWLSEVGILQFYDADGPHVGDDPSAPRLSAAAGRGLKEEG